MPAITTIKLRRGTASAWTSANPVLAAGEMGVETDTNRSKFGDGTTAWTSLSYTVGDSSGIGTIDWTSVLNKPTEFPPEAHTHLLVDVTDVTATATELNYVDGVTSAIQTQLDGKAASVHTHLLADITDYVEPVIPEVTYARFFMLMGA
jgi:hypothetical protein